jgi:hypothetical protein
MPVRVSHSRLWITAENRFEPVGIRAMWLDNAENASVDFHFQNILDLIELHGD